MRAHKINLLDCTLRDGGYYTNWDFKDNIVENYISAMQDLPVDLLEIGYRSIPKKEYFGKYFYYPDFVINKIHKLNRNNKRLALMFNEKDTLPEHLDKLLSGLDGKISLIRLAVDPTKFERALKLGEAIKKRGFNITFNLMYMSKYYQDKSFLAKLKELNGLVEYQIAVDSYGGMLPQQVKELVENMKSNCDEKVGFHGHNNLELAFANTLSAIDAGCDVVDGTIMGMGRGAGNLKTELLLTHFASKGILDFDFNILSKLIELWTPLHKEHEWGTNLPYMVSGANSLPQKDVMEWVTQRFYSFNSIIRALNNQKVGEQDNIRLPIFKPTQYYKNIVVIGGGPNAINHADAIKSFIDKLEDVCIIHASSKNAKSYEEIVCKQFFCLVGNEGHRLESVFNDLKSLTGQCILPPYPRKMGTYLPEVIKEKSFELAEVNFTDQFMDAHTSLALQTALDLKAESIYIAGYDGYDSQTISAKERSLIAENEYIFQKAMNKANLVSITSTHYSLKTESVYSLIS